MFFLPSDDSTAEERARAFSRNTPPFHVEPRRADHVHLVSGGRGVFPLMPAFTRQDPDDLQRTPEEESEERDTRFCAMALLCVAALLGSFAFLALMMPHD